MTDPVTDAVTEIRRHWSGRARAALILGTGLGSLAQQIEPQAVIPFSWIPHFPTATALSHRGRVVCGRLNGVPLVMLDGRCHIYEGYSTTDVTLPVRVMQACGAELLIISNASGGLNPLFRSGDVMIIEDHIDLMAERYPMTANTADTSADVAARTRRSTTALYDKSLIQQSLEVSRQENFSARRGVYVAVTGPNYETRAEYRFLRQIGGDAVGMSTAPEAWAAAELGMRTLGLSIITNVACPDAPHTVNSQQVVDAATLAEPCIRTIVAAVLASAAGG